MAFSTPRNPSNAQHPRIQGSVRPSIRDDRDDTSEGEEVNLDKPILAISYKNKFLGAAFWNPAESVLILLADIQCANVTDMLDLGISLDPPG